ncbi:MAG: hypothetical protein MJ252_18870 [archaeon]|nr:hypothetical protein [archaeon]
MRKNRVSLLLMERRIEHLMKTTNFDQEKYMISLASLTLPPRLQGANFSCLDDLMRTVQTSLNSDDINLIYYSILCLKNIDSYIKLEPYKLISELNKFNIPQIISQVMLKGVTDIKLINETLNVLTNLTYEICPEISSSFITIDYLKCYNEIFGKYTQDQVIINNLIYLLGNLVLQGEDNKVIFYKSNLISLIQTFINAYPLENSVRFSSVWFLCKFIYQVSGNFFFKKEENIGVLLDIADILIAHIDYDNYKINCLVGLCSLSEMEDNNLLNKFYQNEKLIKFVLSQEEKNYDLAMEILCNLSSNYNDGNFELLTKYETLNFLKTTLTSNTQPHIVVHSIWTLTNFIDDCSDEIIRKLMVNETIKKIIELSECFIPLIVKASITFLLTLITKHEFVLLKDHLIRNNICGSLVNVLKNNQQLDILNCALNIISNFVLKERAALMSDTSFKETFIEKGGEQQLNRLCTNFKEENFQKRVWNLQEMLNGGNDNGDQGNGNGNMAI